MFRLSPRLNLRQAAAVEIEVLGNGGGLGEPTTSIRVGDEVLFDAGSGLEALEDGRVQQIRRVYLTHAHADHISALPLLIETLFEEGPGPGVEVFGLPEVLNVLRTHVFNGLVWPDFEKIPDEKKGFLRLTELACGKSISDPSGISLTPFATRHGVPSCGYGITFPSGRRLALTGDTGYDEVLVESLNELGGLDVLCTECSYAVGDTEKAMRFGHLTPELVQRIVAGLRVSPKEVWVGHFKPRFKGVVEAELRDSGFIIPSPGYLRSF
ncbi:MAG: 3',5'-cyclic-nucleotide phosphodiesterase [Verrucomicrobiota bacterium]